MADPVTTVAATVASAYANDPRVTATPAGTYRVDRDGVVFTVYGSGLFGWIVGIGCNLQLLPTRGGHAIHFQTADEAIRTLIGEPR